MARGKFITLEGGEGSGKSTQAQNLVIFLERQGIRALATREVGGAPAAEEIRNLWLSKNEGWWDPLTEVLLIMAARREHLTRTIWPNLEKGTWVISDRYVDSTRAYQGVGLNLGIKQIDALHRQIAGDFMPDLTLLLDLPAEIGMSRMSARQGPDDRYQQKKLEFHTNLRNAYHMLAKQEPERFTTIDASQNIQQVTQSIKKAVAERFQLAASE